jgi:hypothetical protein
MQFDPPIHCPIYGDGVNKNMVSTFFQAILSDRPRHIASPRHSALKPGVIHADFNPPRLDTLDELGGPTQSAKQCCLDAPGGRHTPLFYTLLPLVYLSARGLSERLSRFPIHCLLPRKKYLSSNYAINSPTQQTVPYFGS